MNNTTDTKPVACGGSVMRRTDEHVLTKSIPQVKRSGDSHGKFPMFNTHENTYPDSDPRWGKEQCS